MKEVLTVKAARSLAYRMPYATNDKLRKLSEGTLKYLEHLALTTGTDIADWQLAEFFDAEGQLVSDKKIINKKFFSLKENTKEKKVKPSPLGVSKKICEDFSKRIMVKLNKDHTKLENAVKNAVRNAEHYKSESEKQAMLARKEAARLKNLPRPKDFDLRPQLEVIAKEGFYSFPGQDPEEGVCMITGPVALSYLNGLQARQNFVHMGKYEVQLLVGESGLFARVWPYDDNPIYADMWHPHVDTGGGVCFGDGYALAEKHSKSFDAVEYLALLKKVLFEYNDANPFAKINGYEDAWRRKYLSKGGRLPDDCEYDSDTRRALRRNARDTRRRAGGPNPGDGLRRRLIEHGLRHDPYQNGTHASAWRALDSVDSYWRSENSGNSGGGLNATNYAVYLAHIANATALVEQMMAATPARPDAVAGLKADYRHLYAPPEPPPPPIPVAFSADADFEALLERLNTYTATSSGFTIPSGGNQENQEEPNEEEEDQEQEEEEHDSDTF